MGIEKAYFATNPEGKISIGNQVIDLEDDSKKTFNTDNLKAFEEFTTGRAGESEIYYSESEVSLVPLKADKNFKPLAVCTLKPSPSLALLAANVGKVLDVVKFETLLTALRKYAVGSHMLVLSNLRALTIAKKQTYERDLDNKGNFKLLMIRESATGDWLPPETLVFSLPLFTYLDEKVEITCDFILNVEETGQPSFQLQNLTFVQEVQEARVKVLETRLGEKSTCPKYWGSCAHHAMDNGWKYRENKASF